MFSSTRHWGEIIDDKSDKQYAYLPKIYSRILAILGIVSGKRLDCFRRSGVQSAHVPPKEKMQNLLSAQLSKYSRCLPASVIWVNFSPLIELALNQPVWAPQPPQGALVSLPLDSVTLRAALLAEHARQLEARADLSRQAETKGLDATVGLEASVGLEPRLDPAPAQQTNQPLQHEAKPPLRFIEKEYCSWSRGVAPPSLGRASASDCRRTLVQVSALELATHPASLAATRSVLEAMADAADLFLRQFTTTMRNIADREASEKPSGFPDLISKTLSELGITGLHDWYNERVLGARQRAIRKINLSEPCSVPEEVPELHFPASLEALGEGSLGAGYRMLHSLENADLLPRLPLHLELQLDTSPAPSAGNVT